MYIHCSLTCVRQGYMDPVVSKENTISTGPPGGGGPAFLEGVVSVAVSISSSGSVFAEERLDPLFPFAGVPVASN